MVLLSLLTESYFLYFTKFYFIIYLSPLQLACKCGHPEILKILIGYDVKVNAKKRGEMPPILYAINCISDSEQPDKVSECVEILVEHNADINCAFTDGEYAGETALISACRLNLPEVVKRLIEKKANISAVSKAGKTSLYYAVYNKSLDILNTLLSASPSFEDLNRKYENNKTLVHVCLYKIEQTYQANDSLKVLKVLLDQGLEPDASDSEGDTALHIAAPKKSAVELVKFLIHQGLDPQQTNKKDRTVFSIAHPAIVPVISEALMDEETIAAQQERLKYRREKEKEEMLNRRDEKINAMSKSYVRDDNERTVMINKNAKKHAQLLAMTKRNGTLRTSTPKSAKLTPVKKTEARPWGGSRQTAKFQREMRLKIRNVKKEILGELDELRKAVEDVKKRVYIEAGIISESDEGSQNEDSNFESDEQSFQNTLPPPTETPEATENVEATETPETAEATESTETPETAEATETLDTAEATESTETAEATETLEAAEATETTESSQQPQQMAQAHTEEPTENMDDTSNIIDNLLIDSNTIENNELASYELNEDSQIGNTNYSLTASQLQDLIDDESSFSISKLGEA